MMATTIIHSVENERYNSTTTGCLVFYIAPNYLAPPLKLDKSL